MNLLPCLICAFVLLATATGVMAASTAAPAQPPAPPPAAVPQEPLPEPNPILPAVTLKLDDYINELTSALKLSDDEKKAIVSFYQADDPQLSAILNSDSISPLDQDRRVTEIRAARNAKIKELLGSVDRVAEFLQLEAKYRVGLIEFAMQPVFPAPAKPPAPTPEPAPAPAPAAPVSARTPPPE